MSFSNQILQFGVILLILYLKVCLGNRYNVSYEALGKCKQFNAVVGYNYRTFHRIDELNNYREPDHLLGEDLLRLRLVVLASKDAHLLLSQTDKPEADHAVYEIVIGAGSNTFCEIRRKQKKTPLKTIAIPNVLSPIDPVPLIVKITRAGVVDVTIEGQNKSLISAYDPDPISIKYISFSSWGSTQGKWFYDCPPLPEIKPTEEPIIDVMTTTVEPDDSDWYNPEADYEYMIESYLFSLYDYNTIPEDLYFIDIVNFTMKNCVYDAKNAVLNSFIELTLNWFDPRLSWDPEEFGNVTNITDILRMWSPSLMIHNGKGDTFSAYSPWMQSIIYSDGSVSGDIYFSQIEIFCPLKREQLNWPEEENTCDLILGVHGHNLQLKHNAAKLIYNETEHKPIWKVLEITNVNETKAMIGENEQDADSFMVKEDVVYRIHMHRSSHSVHNISIPPYYAAMLLCLTAFWVRGTMKLTLILLATLILIASILIIGNYAPHSFVPPILLYYNAGLIFSSLNLAAYIFDFWLLQCDPKNKPHDVICKIIYNMWFRFLMLLDQTGVYDYAAKSGNPWSDVALVINRILFIIAFLYTFSVSIIL